MLRDACSLSEKFNTLQRLPRLFNAFMQHSDADYWGILGDNWYDVVDGRTNDFMYRKFAKETLSKIFIATPGNHDYWSMGKPLPQQITSDVCANGWLQFYALDTLAGKGLTLDDAAARKGKSPVDLSIDPNPGAGPSEVHRRVAATVAGQSGVYRRDTWHQVCPWHTSEPKPPAVDYVLSFHVPTMYSPFTSPCALLLASAIWSRYTDVPICSTRHA